MIGVHIAMEEEARPFINEYGLEEYKGPVGRFKYYRGKIDGIFCCMIIPGIGKMNAMVATMSLIDANMDAIINIGSCGANMAGKRVGDVVVPERFYDGDFDLSMFEQYEKNPFKLGNKEEGLKCYSFSRLVTSKVEEGEYVVDMEAYASACLCEYYGREYHSIKIISDNANEDALTDFNQNLKNVMESAVPEVVGIIKRKVGGKYGKRVI